MIYILPASLRSSYDNDTGPRRMLNRVRDALKRRYPTTDIRVDQCVVRVPVTSKSSSSKSQPAFENDDGSFDYPATPDPRVWNASPTCSMQKQPSATPTVRQGNSVTSPPHDDEHGRTPTVST